MPVRDQLPAHLRDAHDQLRKTLCPELATALAALAVQLPRLPAPAMHGGDACLGDNPLGLMWWDARGWHLDIEPLPAGGYEVFWYDSTSGEDRLERGRGALPYAALKLLEMYPEAKAYA